MLCYFVDLDQISPHNLELHLIHLQSKAQLRSPNVLQKVLTMYNTNLESSVQDIQ